MRGLETDHVISGPMRGLKINFTWRGQHSNTHSDRHRNSMIDPAQRAESVKMTVKLYIKALNKTGYMSHWQVLGHYSLNLMRRLVDDWAIYLYLMNIILL